MVNNDEKKSFYGPFYFLLFHFYSFLLVFSIQTHIKCFCNFCILFHVKYFNWWRKLSLFLQKGNRVDDLQRNVIFILHSSYSLYIWIISLAAWFTAVIPSKTFTIITHTFKVKLLYINYTEYTLAGGV